MWQMRLTVCLLASCSVSSFASEPTTASSAQTCSQVNAAQEVDQAEKMLTLTSDEKGVVLPLIRRVIDERNLVSKQNQKSQKALLAFVERASYPTDRAAVASTLAEYRLERNDGEAELRKIVEALHEALTVDNEAKLIALGIIDPPTPRN